MGRNLLTAKLLRQNRRVAGCPADQSLCPGFVARFRWLIIDCRHGWNPWGIEPREWDRALAKKCDWWGFWSPLCASRPLVAVRSAALIMAFQMSHQRLPNDTEAVACTSRIRNRIVAPLLGDVIEYRLSSQLLLRSFITVGARWSSG